MVSFTTNNILIVQTKVVYNIPGEKIGDKYKKLAEQMFVVGVLIRPLEL
jgi:hypothetical protein